jgi:hypothetical protein
VGAQLSCQLPISGTRDANVLAFTPQGIVAKVAEFDEGLIDQAVAEYEAYCAGELRLSVKTREFPNGELQFCGRLEDRSRWTISYVHTADRAVVPLAVGDFGHAFRVLSRLDQADVRFEDPRLFPPPSVRVGGVRNRFLPAQGCSLVGVVQLGAAAVLLSALGERIAVVYVEGGSRVVLDIKSPLGLGEVDVDGMLGFHRPRGACASVRRDVASAERPSGVPAESSPAIWEHHIRIVRGSPVDVGSGPTISEVLRGCFEDIVRRVEALKRPGQKLKGKTKLRAVLDVLLRLALSSCPNLVGRSGEVLAEIRGRAPGLEITVEAFSDVLNLLRAAKTCLVQRDEKERTWRINLTGLADPRSTLHARLCKETAGRLRIVEAAGDTRVDAVGPAAAGVSAEEAAAIAVLGHLRGASLVMLLAGMIAVAQVRRDAEETRMAELTAWEAERRALADQLDTATRERTELVVLLHHLVSLTVRPATRHVPAEYDAAVDEQTSL